MQKISLDCDFQRLFSAQALLSFFFPWTKYHEKTLKHWGTRILVNLVEAAPHFPQPYSLSPQENPRNRVGKSAPNLKYSLTDEERLAPLALTGEVTCLRSEISSRSNKARSPNAQFSDFPIIPPTAIQPFGSLGTHSTSKTFAQSQQWIFGRTFKGLLLLRDSFINFKCTLNANSLILVPFNYQTNKNALLVVTKHRTYFGSGLLYQHDFLHERYTLELNKQTFIRVIKSSVMASSLNENSLTLLMRRTFCSKLIWD